MNVKTWSWLPVALLLSACASKGTVAEPESLKQIAEPEVRGEKIWSYKIGETQGLPGLRPLLAADRIFLGNSNGRIEALDSDGKSLWRVDTGLRLSAGPALADGALVFGTLDGRAVAVEALGGEERWRAKLSSEVISTPGGDQNLVAIRSGDGRIYGLSPRSGERLWTASRSVPPLTLRGQSPVLVAPEAVFLGLDNGRVIALDRGTGEPRWEQPVSLPSGRSEIERIVDIDADLLRVESVLFAASYGGNVVALRGGDGSVLWRREIASYAGLDFDGQCLYVTDADSVMHCLDPSNGSELWQQEQLKHRGLTAPLAYKGNVLVADFEGYLHALSAADGRIIGRTRASGDAVRVPLKRDEQRVYVLDQAGRLQVMDIVPRSG